MTNVPVQSTDRRHLSPHAPLAPLSSRLLLLFVSLLLLRGQLYIGSTFAGTRPPRPDLIPPTSALNARVDQAWQECAQILSAGLSDIGDAARIWLQHSYLGTNPDPVDASAKPQSHGDRYDCRCLVPQVHAGKQPKLTAIVQSFNHHANIPNISAALKAASAVEEIAISEDGSTDGSLHDWHAALTDPSHFVIRSNNLHELRSYNRAMRMSSGDFVVLLQDDDLLPMSDEWVRNAMTLFETLPELGVLGGYIGQLWDHATGSGFEYGEQVSTHGGLRKGDTKPIPFIEPNTGLPFMYAECVWIAPVFIRRSLLRKAGGLKLSIAKRGEPGVWQDCVLSYEAWVNGFSVGTYSAKFERGVGGHGSATSTLKVKQRERVYERAVAYTNRKFPRRRIHDSIVALNNNTLRPRFPSANA
eukprot:GFKZ01012264.1.p1 GENE.GFKZ01012264.1~~GFKZ01012264.1.p1  ORF type:complete len:415 (-),score=49.18 GFKZ01012264.1:203-1447(-)